MNKEQILQLAKDRKIRLVVCAGHVRSENDGQFHFIGSVQLANLYGIPAYTPYVMYPLSEEARFYHWRDQPNDIPLHPMRNGNYSLEDAYKRSGVQA